MPTDAEQLARLKDAVDGVDFEESVTCDGDSIRWAVARIGELEEALEAARIRLMSHHNCETPCRLCDAVAHIDAVLPKRQPCPNCGGYGEYDHEHRDFNGEYLGVERIQCNCVDAALSPAPAKEGEAQS